MSLLGGPCKGSQLLLSPEDYQRWVEAEAMSWASLSLELDDNDIDVWRSELLGSGSPKSYPVTVVWKGVQEFDSWLIYPSDFLLSANLTNEPSKELSSQ